MGVEIFSSVKAVRCHIQRVAGCRKSMKGYGSVSSYYHSKASEVGGRSLGRTNSTSASLGRAASVSTSRMERNEGTYIQH